MRRGLLVLAAVAVFSQSASAGNVQISNGHVVQEVLPVRKDGTVIDPSTSGGTSVDQSGDSSKAFTDPTTSPFNLHGISLNYARDPTNNNWSQIYIDPTTHAMLERTVGPSMNPPGTAGATARTVQGCPTCLPVPVARADGSAIAGDGTDNTGVTQPNGGSGIRGWLSAIYSKLLGTLTTADSNLANTITTAGTAASKVQNVQGSDGNPVAKDATVALLAKDSTVAKDGTDNTGITQPNGGSGIRGWLSAIYTKLTGTLTVGLPTGAATSANQSSEVTQLTTIATRSAIFSDASKASYTASSTNVVGSHSVIPGYSRMSYTAGCSQSATINIVGTDNGFVSYTVVATATIPAGSDSPTITATTPVAPTVSTTATFNAYQAQIVMGTTAGTCTVSSSLTAN